MDHPQIGPCNNGLLPAGSVVELELYSCTMSLEGVDTHTMVVTCDTLKRMMVVPAAVLADTFASYGIEQGSERASYELATAFQLQCGSPEPHLWGLRWDLLLDRRLVSIIKLEIQPKKEESHVTGQS